MRLFIGIDLSDDVKRGAAVAAETLRAELSRVAPRTVLRWVNASNLHITLWFLGEVDEQRTESITAALAPPFTTRSFDLGIAGTGVFPGSGAPRAMWLGIREGAPSLVAIHAELTPRLARVGFEPEARPYSPHLTIARFKDVRRADVAAVRRLLAHMSPDAGACRIDAVTLFRSRPSSKGSEYQQLLRVPLQ